MLPNKRQLEPCELPEILGWSVSRILSNAAVWFTLRNSFFPSLRLGDHLSRAHVTMRLMQPTRDDKTSSL